MLTNQIELHLKKKPRGYYLHDYLHNFFCSDRQLKRSTYAINVCVIGLPEALIQGELICILGKT